MEKSFWLVSVYGSTIDDEDFSNYGSQPAFIYYGTEEDAVSLEAKFNTDDVMSQVYDTTGFDQFSIGCHRIDVATHLLDPEHCVDPIVKAISGWVGGLDMDSALYDVDVRNRFCNLLKTTFEKEK